MIRSSLSLSTHLLPASSPSIELIEAPQVGYTLPAQALLSLQKTLTPPFSGLVHIIHILDLHQSECHFL